MNRKVAILGKGNVGSAIAKGLDGKPYDVRKVGNEPERVWETAAWGDIIVLAVLFDAVNPVVNEIGNAAGQHIGFDPVDAGPLTNARWLETLGYLNIQLGYMVKMGTDIGFALLR